MLRAISAGIQLNRAKALLGHGEFLVWTKKYLGGFSLRSGQHYMALVDGLEAAHPEKWDGIVKLLNVAPDILTEAYGDKVAVRLQGMIEGKSVRELYENFGILKARAHCDDAARKLLEGAPKDVKEQQLYFAKAVFGKVCDSLERFETFVDDLPEEETNDAIVRLKKLLERLTGQKVSFVG